MDRKLSERFARSGCIMLGAILTMLSGGSWVFGDVVLRSGWRAEVESASERALLDGLRIVAALASEKTGRLGSGLPKEALRGVSWDDTPSLSDFASIFVTGWDVADFSVRSIGELLEMVGRGGIGLVQLKGKRAAGEIEMVDSAVLVGARENGKVNLVTSLGRTRQLGLAECYDTLERLALGRRFCFLDGKMRLDLGVATKSRRETTKGAFGVGHIGNDDKLVAIPSGGRLEFGPVPFSSKVREFVFMVTNTTDRAIAIDGLKGECSCFKGGHVPKTLGVGASEQCTVAFDLGGVRPGANGLESRICFVTKDVSEVERVVNVEIGISVTLEDGLVVDPRVIDLGVVREGDAENIRFSANVMTGRFGSVDDLSLSCRIDGAGVVLVEEDEGGKGAVVGDRCVVLRKCVFRLDEKELRSGGNRGEIVFSRERPSAAIAVLRWKAYYVAGRK